MNSSIQTENYQNLCAQLNVFSRSAIELTFQSVRKRDPQLALVIQNILMSQPIEKPKEMNHNKRMDQFIIDFDCETAGLIVSLLDDFIFESQSNAKQILTISVRDQWANYWQIEKGNSNQH